MQEEFVIKNCSIGVPKRTDRDDENLAFFAPDCLNDFYRYQHIKMMEALGLDPAAATQMDSLMAALPFVADYYSLDKDELLQSWVKNHGMGFCFSDT